MAYEELDPQASHRRQGEGWRYVDVRSEQEFAQGHPEGAVNIPIAFPGPMGMRPNPRFLEIVQKHFPADTPLILGCKSGGRSARACEVLAAAGYAKLVNVSGGFLGSPAVAGWQQQGLPASTETAGVSYADLVSD